jgi:hypothetical protein
VPGTIADLAFARIPDDYILGCVDDLGNVLVMRFEDSSDGFRTLKKTFLVGLTLLPNTDPFSGFASQPRISWCRNAAAGAAFGKTLIVSHDNCVEVLNIDRKAGKVLQSNVIGAAGCQKIFNEERIVDFTSAGTEIATAATDGKIRLYADYQGQQEPCYEFVHSYSPINGETADIDAIEFLDHLCDDGNSKKLLVKIKSIFLLVNTKNWSTIQAIDFMPGPPASGFERRLVAVDSKFFIVAMENCNSQFYFELGKGAVNRVIELTTDLVGPVTFLTTVRSDAESDIWILDSMALKKVRVQFEPPGEDEESAYPSPPLYTDIRKRAENLFVHELDDEDQRLGSAPNVKSVPKRRHTADCGELKITVAFSHDPESFSVTPMAGSNRPGNEENVSFRSVAVSNAIVEEEDNLSDMASFEDDSVIVESKVVIEKVNVDVEDEAADKDKDQGKDPLEEDIEDAYAAAVASFKDDSVIVEFEKVLDKVNVEVKDEANKDKDQGKDLLEEDGEDANVAALASFEDDIVIVESEVVIDKVEDEADKDEDNKDQGKEPLEEDGEDANAAAVASFEDDSVIVESKVVIGKVEDEADKDKYQGKDLLEEDGEDDANTAADDGDANDEDADDEDDENEDDENNEDDEDDEVEDQGDADDEEDYADVVESGDQSNGEVVEAGDQDKAEKVVEDPSLEADSYLAGKLEGEDEEDLHEQEQEKVEAEEIEKQEEDELGQSEENVAPKEALMLIESVGLEYNYLDESASDMSCLVDTSILVDTSCLDKTCSGVMASATKSTNTSAEMCPSASAPRALVQLICQVSGSLDDIKAELGGLRDCAAEAEKRENKLLEEFQDMRRRVEKFDDREAALLDVVTACQQREEKVVEDLAQMRKVATAQIKRQEEVEGELRGVARMYVSEMEKRGATEGDLKEANESLTRLRQNAEKAAGSTEEKEDVLSQQIQDLKEMKEDFVQVGRSYSFSNQFWKICWCN